MEKVSLKAKFALSLASTGGLALLVLFATSVTTVDPGQVGVLVRLGSVKDEALTEGFHWIRPFVDRVVQVDGRVRKQEITCQAGSKDLQIIKTMVAVNYRFNKEQIPNVYRQIGTEESFEATVLAPATHEAVKAVVSQYNAEELLKRRSEVRGAMEQSLRDKLNTILPGSFIVSAFNVIDFDFTDSFNAAIEAKQVAEQKAQQTQNEIIMERAEADKKIEQARGRSESAKTEAEGAAASARLRAEGEAAAIRSLALARSEAITLEGQTLQQNPQILKLRLLERWDGTLPRVTGGSDAGFQLLLPVDGSK